MTRAEFIALWSFTAQGSKAEQPKATSLVALIAHPAAFDGRVVSTIGIMSIDSEGATLFLSRDDFDAYIAINGVSLSLTRTQRQRRELHGHYVALRGTFRAGMSGHFGNQSGRIESIQDLGLFPRIRGH